MLTLAFTLVNASRPFASEGCVFSLVVSVSCRAGPENCQVLGEYETSHVPWPVAKATRLPGIVHAIPLKPSPCPDNSGIKRVSTTVPPSAGTAQRSGAEFGAAQPSTN